MVSSNYAIAQGSCLPCCFNTSQGRGASLRAPRPCDVLNRCPLIYRSHPRADPFGGGRLGGWADPEAMRYLPACLLCCSNASRRRGRACEPPPPRCVGSIPLSFPKPGGILRLAFSGVPILCLPRIFSLPPLPNPLLPSKPPPGSISVLILVATGFRCPCCHPHCHPRCCLHCYL